MNGNIHPQPSLANLKLVVLISGGGTTLQNLIQQIAQGQLEAQIELVISSNPAARGIQMAAEAGIATAVIERNSFESVAAYSAALFDCCRAVQPHFVVMGGFLKLVRIPPDFENRVVNIHPSLIPNFCGQGMYGHHVHQAALAAGVAESGCTVHFVDNQYDHGPIILQRRVPVLAGDTPDTLAARVFQAECGAYPAALRLLASGRRS